MLDMTDFELWYVKTRQDEIRQQAALYRAAQRDPGHRTPRRHRWLRRLGAFLATWGLRRPALPTTRLAPAVVRAAQKQHGGSNVWQHRAH